MSFVPELDDLDFESLCKKFLEPPFADHNNTYIYHEIAVRIREIGGKEGKDFLLAQLNRLHDQGENFANEDDPYRWGAIYLALNFNYLNPEISKPLTWREKRLLKKIMLTALEMKSLPVLMNTILQFGNLRDKSVFDKVLSFSDHPDGHIAGHVLIYFRKLKPLESVPFLVEALTDTRAIARHIAADEIWNLALEEIQPHDPIYPLLQQAYPHVKKLIDDEDNFVREAAVGAIEMLDELFESS